MLITTKCVHDGLSCAAWYTSSSENLAFRSDKMGGKDHCRVTTCRLKARIPRNVCPFVSVTKQYIPICGADLRMIPNLLTDSAAVFVFVFFPFVFVFLHLTPVYRCFSFSPSYSSVPAVHLITTVYITIVRTRECVCVREAGE